jgi:hypothetical protein
MSPESLIARPHTSSVVGSSPTNGLAQAVHQFLPQDPGAGRAFARQQLMGQAGRRLAR